MSEERLQPPFADERPPVGREEWITTAHEDNDCAIYGAQSLRLIGVGSTPVQTVNIVRAYNETLQAMSPLTLEQRYAETGKDLFEIFNDWFDQTSAESLDLSRADAGKAFGAGFKFGTAPLLAALTKIANGLPDPKLKAWKSDGGLSDVEMAEIARRVIAQSVPLTSSLGNEATATSVPAKAESGEGAATVQGEPLK